MRFYSLTLSVIIFAGLIFSGCTKQPEPPVKVVIDASLPVPSLNGHISEMEALAFEWKSIQDPQVEGYYVYRSDPKAKDEKLQRIATLKGRYITHYVDTDLTPNQLYMYRFSSYNAAGAESQASATYRASTLPLMPSVSFFASLGNLPRSAKLIWRPHTDTQVKGYRIERKLKSENVWESVATIDKRLMAEYIDTDLKDGQSYQYRIFALTYSGLTSSPSNIVTVVTKPLPEPVTNIKATTQLPKKILISWDPSSRENLSHYNIYRATSPEGGYNYHVKLTETSFSDPVDKDGARYYYKVSAVDDDGLESLLNMTPALGSTLPKPKTPLHVKGRIQQSIAKLSWKKADPDTQSYVIIKTKKSGWLDSSVIEIKDITVEHFNDTEITPDTTYFYQVATVNQYGIRSEPSESVELTFEGR